MSAVRSLLFGVYFFVITLTWAVVVMLFAWPLPSHARYRFVSTWCVLTLFGARWICGIRHRAIGVENIPQGDDAAPHIVMCKHSSTWDTVALPRYFPPLSYVAKKELMVLPIFGCAFALASPITINRKSGSDAMAQIVRQGRERFRQGFWFVIYPEGTRIKAGTRGKYKTGGARLAIDLRVPIIPVAHNAGYLWPRGLFGKRPGTITISFGQPIVPDDKDAATLTAEVEHWIEAEVARLGRP